MKRMNLLVLGMLVSSQILMAGGLVTNVNQSAAWVRMLARNATLGVDAVYFNPAGLAQLNNGLHLSVSNQTIFQTRTISSDYPYLAGSPATYEADLMAPIFPSIYAAFKVNKWTFSGGFNIIGGGGSADFPTGLPSFEIPVASLVPMLQGALAPIDQGILDAIGTDPGFRSITGYNLDASFNGTSAYMGYQLGATYAVNDMLSVFLGARMVMASNSYEGSLSRITIDAPVAYGGTMPAGDYLRIVALTPGLDPTTVGLLNGTAAALDIQTADKELNATQKGTGFTPIIGVNLHLSDMLNVAVKYEHHTKIELTNDTEADDVGMFPDGEKVRADLPGMLSLGAELKPINKLTASVGFNYFLDKPAYYGKTDEAGEQINNELSIDQNGYTFSAGLEYKLLGILGVSAGYYTGNNGVNASYQSDLSYALKSQTVGGGVFVDVGEKITINAGVSLTMYDDYSKSQSYQPTGFPQAVPFADVYGKNTMIVAVGVDISL
ncbi:MAG: outer membrane beta-barrel protein [Bacteroidales bacterium]|nr:outer membrane beta-barrel protein [Bacteroidales bacterium]